jgi:PPM family protein phosphatase
MTLALRYAVRSDVGLLREGNEDSAYAGPHLLAVADGMGGYEAGEVASAAVISTVAPLDRSELTESDLIDALGSAVTTAKQTLRHIVDSDPAVGSMGTTLTAMLWSGGTAAVCHIGDSRAYLLRDGEFYQITRDHTFVQALVDQGRIRPEEIATHPQRSLLLRALDGRTDADPDLSLLTAQVGDRYLLCSDGLPVAVSDELILQALAEIAEPADAVLQLIELAIKGGGPDNITCIVADVVDTAAGSAKPTTAPLVVGAAAGGGGHDTKPITKAGAVDDHGVTGLGTMPAAMAGADGTLTADPRTAPGAPRRQEGRPASRSPQLAGSGGRRAAHADSDTRPPGLRRWPVMTSVLVLLGLLIIGGLIFGYQYIHSQYYIGTRNNEVVVFRGVNGLPLTSISSQTGIPLAEVPTDFVTQIRGNSIAGNNAYIQGRLAIIRRGYLQCHSAYARIRFWETHRTRQVTKTVIVHGKPRKKPVTVPIQKPSIPQACPPFPG